MTGPQDPPRRIFIRDFGRGALAVAIGGPALLAACGDDQPASTDGSAAVTDSTAASPTSASSAPATSATPTTASTDTSAAPSEPGLTVEPVVLGNVSAYLMVRGAEVAVVDTGFPGDGARIGEALAEVGLGWGAVSAVILTHRHPDHVGGLSGVLDEVGDVFVGTGAGDLDAIASPRPLEALADGQEVFGATIVATPGHTPGHVAVWDQMASTLIAGDALNGDGGSVATVDGVGGPNSTFTPDMEGAIESAKKLAALAPDAIFFGHGRPKVSGAAAALNALVEGL